MPQKIRHKEDSPHNKYVTENLNVTVGQTFATVQMWKIRHTTMIDWGGGLGRESWGWGVGVWGRGVEVRGSGLGGSQFPPTPPQPNPPDFNHPNPNPPDRAPRPITVVRGIFRIGTVANVCPTPSDQSQPGKEVTLLKRSKVTSLCMCDQSHPVCGVTLITH